METPRRRNQNREETAEKTSGAQTTGRNIGLNGAENCIQAVEAMKRELSSARKYLINAEMCVVNRGVLQSQLDYLEKNLPDTVRKAAQIVKEEETIRHETEETRNQILGEARAKGQAMVNEADGQARSLMERANQEANALMDRANQEATACVEAARAEAARMLEDAEKKARQMVEEETIMRRARAESEELREKARQEAAQLRTSAMDFVDRQLMEVDRAISDSLNAVRLERNEVRNRR